MTRSAGQGLHRLNFKNTSEFDMTFRSKLVGTWMLLSMTMVDSEDRLIAHPFGEHIKGSLVYSSDGYMSSLLSGPEAKPWAKWNDPSAEEALTAAKLITGYTGKFFLDEVPGNKQTVFHQIRIGMPPNLEGATQERHVEIFDKDSHLHMTIRVNHDVEWSGHKGRLLLQWKKEERNDAKRSDAVVEQLGAR
jgi:hypothetical protein